MALPWIQGALHPAWLFLWRLPDGSMKDLTGLVAGNFSLVLHPINSAGSDITGGGTFTIISVAGQVQYQPVANDVATAGIYQLILIATFPGSLPDKSQPLLFPILAT